MIFNVMYSVTNASTISVSTRVDTSRNVCTTVFNSAGEYELCLNNDRLLSHIDRCAKPGEVTSSH